MSFMIGWIPYIVFMHFWNIERDPLLGTYVDKIPYWHLKFASPHPKKEINNKRNADNLIHPPPTQHEIPVNNKPEKA